MTPGHPDDAFEEYDTPKTIAAITGALQNLHVLVAADPAAVLQRVRWLQEKYGCPVLVEE